MNFAPKRSSETTAALASMCGRTSFEISIVTRTLLTRSSATRATRPFLTPETSTGSPCFRPATLSNITSTESPLVRNDRPVNQNMPTRKTATPTSTIAPTPTSCL